MKTERQYIEVQFPNGERTYTYHHDGDPVGAGEQVKLPGRGEDDGWQRGTVVTAFVDKPAFETKAILGVIEPDGMGGR
jgi:hypothetical protein